jgi:RpiR family transcriptional regulator, repressor of rpiB and als operon
MNNAPKIQAPEIEQVGPRIRIAMQTMTEKEREILQGCLSLGGELKQHSVQDIAARHHVSAAMVVKVSQRCGFSGFKELKDCLVAYSQLPVVDLHEELNPQDDTHMVIEKVFKTAIKALQETLTIFDYAALEKAAQALRSASSIEIYGVGGSGAMAFDAFHKFLRIGIRTQVFTDSHMLVMSSSLVNPRSAVLCFSHSGRTHAIVEALRIAKEHGATTIAITNSPHSPMAQFTDILLYSVAQGSPITGESAAARIVQLNILDALFVLVAQSDYDRSLQNLKRTIESVDSLRAI